MRFLLLSALLFVDVMCDDRGSCQTTCQEASKQCVGTNTTDTAKIQACTKEAMMCGFKCEFGDNVPQKDLDCLVTCSTSSMECALNAGGNMTKSSECSKTGETCSRKCFDDMMPACLKGQQNSTVFKCYLKTGANSDPKSCADVKHLSDCMLSECGGGIPPVANSILKLDKMKQQLCGGSIPGGPDGPDVPTNPCMQKCHDAIKQCIGTNITDTAKIQACSKEAMGCHMKCQFGDSVPQKDVDCLVTCAMSSMECQQNAAGDMTKRTECSKTGSTCSQKCMDDMLPACLKGQENSTVFKCALTAGANSKPKTCKDVNYISKCMTSECGGIPAIANALFFDQMIKQMCPTLSPTVVGGTMSPTGSDYVAFSPTSKPIPPTAFSPTSKPIPPTAKPETSAASTLHGALLLVSVLVVLMQV